MRAGHAVRPWLGSPALVAAIGSLLASGAAVAVAPDRWGLTAFHALLLGGALYAGALRAHVARQSNAGAAFWRGALIRAAAFLLFAGTQAVVCFDLAPGADVRGFFVIFSAWVVAENAMR